MFIELVISKSFDLIYGGNTKDPGFDKLHFE